MNILKKIAAATLAAVSVVTCVAVTASADYKIEGNPRADSDKYGLTIWGIPEEALKYSEFQLQIILDDDRSKFLVLNGYQGGVLCESTISAVRADDSSRLDIIREMPAERAFNLGTQQWVFSIEIDKDDEDLAKMMTRTNLQCVLTVFDDDGNMLWIDSDGKVLGNSAMEEYIENVTLDLKALSSSSEPTSSEPTSSEPVSSEPVSSEPVSSEPVSEPASEPVSEPTSSTPASTETSKPSEEKPNPTTGVGGIAFAVAAAAIAGSAVIVARRKK